MRSSGRAAAAFVLGLTLVAGVEAQSNQSKELYTEAVSREQGLRKEIEALRPGATSESVIRRIRALVSAYEDMARLFPASGYSDNALWQGASLAADAFWQFGEATDRTTSLRLFEALTTRFAGSTMARKAPDLVKRLSAATPAPPPEGAPPVVASRPQPATAETAAVKAPAPPGPPPARPPTVPATVALTAIRREVLPDTLRITLELDREVPFHDERIDGPPRVFLDLENTRAVSALRDAVLPFSDDLIQRVRVGRQLDSRTRVVLDLATAQARYSVYTLYNPYRIVVDFERQNPVVTPPAGKPSPGAERSAASVADRRTATAARTAPAADTAAPPAPPPAAPAANATGNFSLSRQLGLGAARIVIDAGHGGHDPGAKARGLSEAELVLDVALRLEKLLVQQPGIEVVMTRRTDSFVPLEERTEIANRENADLFLSIHANASADASARGVETYFLNFAANPEAEAVAARENAGAAKNMRHLPEIVRSIALNNKIDESRDFAGAVQASLHGQLKKANRTLKNLGVKQAPFMVLIGATMPSVLAEISFITSRQESTLLKTEKYRQQIAEALAAGIVSYQQSLKTGRVAAK